MMRQIVLDTETTGLEYKQGHRIVEIAAVEICNRQLTGNHFHQYLNPGRDSDPGALQVHGLTREFLEDKPKFNEISQTFIDFIRDTELIIHNAPFDVGFLNHELGLINLQILETYCAEITDTLKLAKELHPGKRNNLDVLCDRYKIDNSKRTLHGALLDAELLAEVYLAMTRGQEALLIDLDLPEAIDRPAVFRIDDLDLRIIPATESECRQHAELLARIEKENNSSCLWTKNYC